MHLLALRLPPLAAEVLAGYVAGSAKTLALYPLDTLTTLRETRATRAWGLRDLKRFYAGCGLTLLGALPFAVLFHTAFWLCEAVFLSGSPLPSATVKLCASVCGAMAATTIGVPFEVLKHRLQLGTDAYRTPRRALATTLRDDGVRGLWVGFGATLARNVPYNALHFGLFELFVFQLRRRAITLLSADGCNLLAGALAGAITALLTTPMDLVNTRLQTQAVGALSTPSDVALASSFNGPLECLMEVARVEGGVPALFRGAEMRVAQYAPSALIFFYVYGWVKRAAGLV